MGKGFWMAPPHTALSHRGDACVGGESLPLGSHNYILPASLYQESPLISWAHDLGNTYYLLIVVSKGVYKWLKFIMLIDMKQIRYQSA